MPALTIYRIRDDLDGAVPAVFDRILDAEELAGCVTHDYADDLLTARLYVPPTQPQAPRWAGFIGTGFPDAEIGLRSAQDALIVASVRRYNRDRLFALSFGQGRFLIRPELIEPAFGRRVALNLLYEDAPDDEPAGQSRIRQVDARTIEANVRRARIQRSRDTSFDTFGVDPQRDLLDRIVGAPPDVETFGSRISGADSLQLHVDVPFEALGPLLRTLLSTHARTTYRDHFAWVDRVRAVDDPNLLERLRAHTVEVVAGGADDIDLAPPEIVDWSRVATFRFEIGEKPEHDDLRLDDYLAAVEGSRVTELDYDRFVGHKITARDGDGGIVAKWSVARSLFGDFELDGAHYVLDNGRFFVVAADYVEELNDFVAGLPGPTTMLPATGAAILEDAYNQALCTASPGRLLLDRRTIQPAERTTSIEICDVITSDGELIHVKRKLGSSDLSHLFGQGFVSAEVINSGPAFRTVVRDKITVEAQAQNKTVATFAGLIVEPFSAQHLTVVYAVLANWKGKPPEERLPFFSKVNLRHHTQQISRMGYGVAFAAVDAN